MAEYSNNNMAMITGGRVYYPKIAVGSFNVLQFEGCVAATKRTISVGSNSVTVTIGTDGKATVSLLPFVRNDMAARNVQNVPLTTSWRGALSVAISGADSTTTVTTLTIYYIYGYLRAAYTLDSDVWLTYNNAIGDYNVVGVDLASHYTSGVPNSLDSFRAINNDPSGWENPPTEGSAVSFEVQQVAGGKIFTGNKTYHFTLDCRDSGVVQLRWVDENGFLTTRKFAKGVEKMGASISNAYRRPHNDHILLNGNSYDFGYDEWANIEPQRTLTIGEDSIPSNQYEWVKSLITSPAIDMLRSGGWCRVNLSSPSIERETRKATFSLSLTLALWSEDIQQF